MRSNLLIGGLLASVMIVPAFAQSNPPASTAHPAPAATSTMTTTNKVFSDQWRASKLIGLNVYNEQNEKLGDISEILLDKSGKVEGVVIGVGGFLGMGQHDIKVDMAKLKFVDEPVKTSSTTTTSTTGAANDARRRRPPRPGRTRRASSGIRITPCWAALTRISSRACRSSSITNRLEMKEKPRLRGFFFVVLAAGGAADLIAIGRRAVIGGSGGIAIGVASARRISRELST